MKRLRILAILNAVTLVIHISLSYLTQVKAVNSQDVGEVSSKYPSLFTPAPITFAVWGVIYLTLGIFVVYHIIKTQKANIFHPANASLKNIGPWFIINNLLTASWLIAWTNEKMVLSVVLILAQLLSLIVIHLRADIYRPRLISETKYFSQAPLSIYFGWITIATIANVSSWLASTDWNGAGIGSVSWTFIMIIAAGMIATLVITTRKNVFYGLVVLWALYGIILKHASGAGEGDFEIVRTAWFALGVVGLVCVLQMVRNTILARSPEAPFPVDEHSLK
ncbi:MAG: tryptophan-rich sensory protein [Gemmatimonadaceae bacterium]|nr:tryptophan-rich sensory protein [Chitinophagaceae bacterium]